MSHRVFSWTRIRRLEFVADFLGISACNSGFLKHDSPAIIWSSSSSSSSSSSKTLFNKGDEKATRS